MRIQYPKPFFWSMTETEILQKALDDRVCCYLIRVGAVWHVITEAEFERYRKNLPQLVCLTYFMIRPSAYETTVLAYDVKNMDEYLAKMKEIAEDHHKDYAFCAKQEYTEILYQRKNHTEEG